MKRSQSEASPHQNNYKRSYYQWPSLESLSTGVENNDTSNNTSFNTTKSSIFNDSGISSLYDSPPYRSPIKYKKEGVRYISPLNTPKFINSNDDEPQKRIEEPKKFGRVLFPNDYNNKENKYINENSQLGVFVRQQDKCAKNQFNYQRTPNSSFYGIGNSSINRYSDESYPLYSNAETRAISPEFFYHNLDEGQKLIRSMGLDIYDPDSLFYDESYNIENDLKNPALPHIKTPSPIKRFIEEEKRVMEKRERMYRRLSYESAKHLVNIHSCKTLKDIILFQKKAFEMAFRDDSPDTSLYRQIKSRKYNILKSKYRNRQIEQDKYFEEQKKKEKENNMSKEMSLLLYKLSLRGKKVFSDSFVKYCFHPTQESELLITRAQYMLSVQTNSWMNSYNLP
uniref:Uncharacterized protein n=1 Tax=Parastrongyloides trichosuri TaxID=131310 RepID=A0A0N4ZCL1_PARTI